MAIIFNLDKLLATRKMQSIELAETLGCTVQTVSRIKKGKVRAFRIETIDSLCELFHCQPGDILEYVDDEEVRERFGDKFLSDYGKYCSE
ncbi:helix-turn-helix domain-containing protein [Eggerthella sinensis]|uniref:helix-turn-helix domain-containing protein n=1 Tax=Eggerthella sinensis TaxID=242230 RepID=UPI0022E96EED|nr:helix-turn-helix transcriptional regulator [Eggerthella sinensis]